MSDLSQTDLTARMTTGALICCLAIAGVTIIPSVRGEEPPVGETGNEEEPEDDWSVGGGVGLKVEPVYEGDADLEVEPVPLVRISWRGIVTLGPEALVVNTPDFGRISGALSLGYNEGRDEDDSDDLDGLGNIDPAAQAGLDISIALGAAGQVAGSLDAEVRRDLGGSNGVTVEAGPTLAYELTPAAGVKIGASAVWADRRHMEDYFGVSAGQSAASGLEAFDADAGFKRVDMTAGGEWKPSEHWMLIGEAGVGRLIGNAADSPITEDEVQTSLFFGIAYLF
jgi:outer membrane scaffolding protein for murein synthesis (MipA/OmpV family)